LDVLKERLPVARVVFDPRTVREARDGQRGVKARVQPNSGSAQGTLGGASQWNTPGVYYADLTLGGRVITVKLLRKHDSGTHVRYLYTTDLSLSGEEACLAGDRGPQRDVKAHSSFWGASGLPHDLHRQQRPQGAGGGA
jgi:hypothetical protein